MPIALIETDGNWSSYLSIDDAEKLDRMPFRVALEGSQGGDCAREGVRVEAVCGFFLVCVCRLSGSQLDLVLVARARIKKIPIA
jgi:hypothetical protein